jgi:hypothetical protein
MIFSFCKDQHFGMAVPTDESRRMLNPQVNSKVPETTMVMDYTQRGWPSVHSFCCAPVGHPIGGASAGWMRLKY